VRPNDAEACRRNVKQAVRPDGCVVRTIVFPAKCEDTFRPCHLGALAILRNASTTSKRQPSSLSERRGLEGEGRTQQITSRFPTDTQKYGVFKRHQPIESGQSWRGFAKEEIYK
jgi:hypothetical protein